MDIDLLFFVGVAIVLIGLPTFVNAFSERRPPRLAALLFALGGGLIYYAMSVKPEFYTFDSIPTVFVSTMARYLP